MNKNNEKCFVCGNDEFECKWSCQYGVDLMMCDCKKCGIFFSTLGEVDRSVFSPYLFEKNKRRHTYYRPGIEINPSHHKVIFIVSEGQKKNEIVCGKLKNALLSEKWATKDDKIKFVTIEDVKEMGYT